VRIEEKGALAGTFFHFQKIETEESYIFIGGAMNEHI